MLEMTGGDGGGGTRKTVDGVVTGFTTILSVECERQEMNMEEMEDL